ncbi:MAG: DUF1062 domain-containing protein [Bacteroidales bacterium]|jgi:hypothetical protein|nr:DUF1062 domain-containing protein [Bacteroidales bacterium]
MKNIIWQVTFIKPPAAIRHCKKCNQKSYFVSSGFFRVNAQKRLLDIWLIYNCIKCNYTWNATLFSRINPNRISAELLHKFHTNDEKLAFEYAMNADILQQKNSIVLGTPEYCLSGEDIDFNSTEDFHITLLSDYYSKINTTTVIREKLNLTKIIFRQWMDQGYIYNIDGSTLKNCKLNKKSEFIIKGLRNL